MLPFSGRSDGSIYFRDGKVAFAESTRTPGPAPHDPPAPDQPPLDKITAILDIAEPTVDAALELLSVQSRYTNSGHRRSRTSARRRTSRWAPSATAKANLALARHNLKRIENDLSV
jgi:hypothetical protein